MQYEFTNNDFPKRSTSGTLRRLWLTPRAKEPTEGAETFVKRMGDRTMACDGSLSAQVKRGSSPVVSPVRTFRVRERAKESQGTGRVFGLPCGTLLGYYDPGTASLKTLEQSLIGDSMLSLETLPRSGTMRSGKIYAQATWVLRTEGKESGLWPTPTTPRPHDNEKTAGKYIPSQNQKDLTYAVAHDYAKENKEMEDFVTGQLNPTWVEWLMGYPSGWTDLKDLAIALSLKSRNCYSEK
jgi:hypothetical protein